ncbi:MAG: hypothetical protein U1E26_08375 [Coriobacteriia bacterium]|nr:hypothetical protein [Coriobacteriia bacterium]
MPRPRTALAFAIVAGALVLLTLAAWGLDLRARKAAGPYHVTVEKSGREVASYSIEELRALGMRKVVMDGKLEEGPPLLAVLADAGVAEFTSVTVTGPGVRDSGTITLARRDIDEDVLLDFALRGTTKLCGPEIEYSARVRDVERVIVE